MASKWLAESPKCWSSASIQFQGYLLPWTLGSPVKHLWSKTHGNYGPRCLCQLWRRVWQESLLARFFSMIEELNLLKYRHFPLAMTPVKSLNFQHNVGRCIIIGLRRRNTFGPTVWKQSTLLNLLNHNHTGWSKRACFHPAMVWLHS